MPFTKLIYSIFILAFSFSFLSCSSKTTDKKDSVQKVDIGTPVKTSEPSNAYEVEKVRITAHLHNDKMNEDIEFYFPVDTEKLAIGGMPLTITEIQGLEQLKKIKRIALLQIDDRFSDVIDSIKVFGDTVEAIIFLGCNLKDLNFLQSFPNLKAILLSGSRIDIDSHFDFSMFKQLEYFYMRSTTMKIIRDATTGQVKKMDKLTPEERDSITLRLVPSPAMKFISIDTNEYPIIIDNETLELLKDVPEVAIFAMSFERGGNDYGLIQKYKNFEVYKDSWNPPNNNVPKDYQLEELRKYANEYEVITN